MVEAAEVDELVVGMAVVDEHGNAGEGTWSKWRNVSPSQKARMASSRSRSFFSLSSSTDVSCDIWSLLIASSCDSDDRRLPYEKLSTP